MSNFGVLRKVDSLGRFTLPKEFRRLFCMEKDSKVEVVATEDGILIRNPNIKIIRSDNNE